MLIDSFGKPFYLVEVLAFFLKILKKFLMCKLQFRVNIISADIHWVIAVPVELNQLIREAAGLVS